MFIFGLGVSPLAVVQESIIVRFFKNHGLGLSMALGLVAGKAASFVSARTSFPLSEKYGPRAPFVAATSLAALSFIMNVVYLSAAKWLVRSSGTELEASELRDEARAVESISEAQALKQIAKKRTVHLRDITKLGDVFWAYVFLYVLHQINSESPQLYCSQHTLRCCLVSFPAPGGVSRLERAHYALTNAAWYQEIFSRSDTIFPRMNLVVMRPISSPEASFCTRW